MPNKNSTSQAVQQSSSQSTDQTVVSEAGLAAGPVLTSFAQRFIKRNGHLVCHRCLNAIEKLPHDCRNLRPYGAR